MEQLSVGIISGVFYMPIFYENNIKGISGGTNTEGATMINSEQFIVKASLMGSILRKHGLLKKAELKDQYSCKTLSQSILI